MAGQVTETFVLTRSCLEYAAYALHIQGNPGYDLVWWDRNQSAKHKKTAITSFALGRLRETIEKHDKRLAALFDELYRAHNRLWCSSKSVWSGEQPFD